MPHSKKRRLKKMNKALILALQWMLNGLWGVFGLSGWDVILLLVKLSWTDWFVLFLLMMYFINQTVPITINTTSPMGWNCEINRRCGDLWWWSVAPARGFRHGKVDVAVTSMPEMTRIGTLTPGLISFSPATSRALEIWCNIDSSELEPIDFRLLNTLKPDMVSWGRILPSRRGRYRMESPVSILKLTLACG